MGVHKSQCPDETKPVTAEHAGDDGRARSFSAPLGARSRQLLSAPASIQAATWAICRGVIVPVRGILMPQGTVG
jgi:hypothetical protein